MQAANAPSSLVETETPEAKITEASSVQPGGTEDNESDKTGVKDNVAAEPEAAKEDTLDQEVAPVDKCDAPATANAAEPSAEHVQKSEGVNDRVAAEPEAAGEATLDQEVTPSENCDAPNAAEPSAEYVQKPEHAAPAGKDTMAAETVKDLP